VIRVPIHINYYDWAEYVAKNIKKSSLILIFSKFF
jgi:hypothetical protein